MGLINDEKPRVILNEYKITQNIPTKQTVLDETFNLKSFRKQFRVVVIRHEESEMEFDLIGLHPYLANAFRRLMLSDVPSMAIEKVHIYNNTSIIQDEVLAHRLGLIPLKADPRLFKYKSDDSDGTEEDTLEYELKVHCTNKEVPTGFINSSGVYSGHIKRTGSGSQPNIKTEKTDESDKDGDESAKNLKSSADLIHSDILIAKLRPGHVVDIKLIAVKGTGRDHAKFSPVATAFYRLLPDISLLREIKGEAAERLQKCFSPGVIELKETKDGQKVASVKNARYDTCSRNVFRYDDLRDAVVMTKIQDHFIFTVESLGALPPEVIFTESVKILKDKCLSLLAELNQS